MRTVIERFVSLVERGKLGRWFLVVLLAGASSVLEALGALLVLSLLGSITDLNDGVDLPIIGDLQSVFPGSSDRQVFTYSLIIIGCFFIFRAVFLIGQAYVQQRVIQNAGLRLSMRLFRGYLRMPYAFHLRRNSAELIRNTQESVERIVGEVYIPAVGFISHALIIAGLFIVLAIASPLGTLLAVVVMTPLVLIVLKVLQPRLNQLGTTNQVIARDTIQTLQQSFQGLREIRVFGARAFFERTFWNIRSTLARLRYMRAILADVPRVLLETALVLFILAFLGLRTAQGNAVEDAIPILGLFAYAALRLMPLLNHLVSNINDLRYGSANLRDIHTDLKIIEETVGQGEIEPAERLAFLKVLELDHVGFTYEGSDEPALTDLIHKVERGESIGIVGPTGGGKTTLIDLILGLLPPTEGRVRVDGVDIQQELPAWQRNLGMVPQTIFLLDDSIRHNIAFGQDAVEIDEQRLWRAVRMAQLEPFIRSLPEGLDALVGERGVRISGGQRQRVAIARALYRDPEVLVFDEGTSALDNLTEAALMGALEELRGVHTLITVAHRLSTVKGCDRILIIKEGRIVDEGTYDDLSLRHAEFRSVTG